ncbi:MAG: bifunctional hemolysin-adenylate cyclase precursor [Caulobacteraceae bacterium]|nr:bifunctional hemolysin-adenylate cyclase precursor [Caulobacteraceae bacterium]
MAIILGLGASYSNSRNGMILEDMHACEAVARKLGDVIIFRSTGPWAKRWIEKGHPTKNFHVKGKSSDWGPQAGLVPYDAMYSKKPDKGSEAERTKACQKSVDEGWARAAPLVLTRSEIDMQLNRKEGNEVAIRRSFPTPGGDILLYAGPQGSAEEYVFRARRKDGRGDLFEVHVYKDQAAALRANAFRLADAGSGDTKPLLVMVSNEVGADNRGLTGDYDLFVVVPTWASYGSRLGSDVVKPGINLQGRGMQAGQTFSAGVGMDNVLDPSLHTFGHHRPMGPRTAQTSAKFDAAVAQTPRSEHKDMGNLTPRVLRCINALNAAMAGGKGVGRRVHHNAENYRNAMFGALTAGDMNDTAKGGGGHGDGFPLTAFMPADPKLAAFGSCCTLENYHDLQKFGAALNHAGYYVPKNAAWGMTKAYNI